MASSIRSCSAYRPRWVRRRSCGGEVGTADHLAQPGPLLVGLDGHGDPGVGACARVDALRSPPGMAIARAGPIRARFTAAEDLRQSGEGGALVLRQVDPLSLAGAAAFLEGGQGGRHPHAAESGSGIVGMNKSGSGSPR